jgi:hypothetical protein
MKYKINLFILLYFFTVSAIVSYIKFDFPTSIWTDFIWSFDGLGTQVQAQAIINSGPFLSTNHLGYPVGFSQWTVPQFGLLHVIYLWVISNLVSASSFGLLTIYSLIILWLNGFSVYVLIFRICKIRSFSITMGTVFLLTPYAINQLARPHVMSLYFFPALLYFIIVQGQKTSLDRKRFLVLILVFVSISIFWSFTILYILLPIIFILIVLKIFGIKFDSKYFNSLMLSFLAVFIGLISNLVFFLLNNYLRGEEDRFPWQSDIFAGKFSDLFVSSPFLNVFFPSLDSFNKGASFESNHLHLGIFYVILFFFAFFTVIYSTIIEKSMIEIRIISTFALISLFYFFVGGLSNLQAGIFNFFGIVTPMRSWARLSILVSICGLFLLTYTLVQINKIFLFKAISLMAFLVAVLDFVYIRPALQTSNNFEKQEEFNSLAFLNENFKPCPVIQLPIDTYVLPQGWLDNAERYYWSQLKPYVILPSFYWTGGTYTESPGWSDLKFINSTLNEKDLATLGNKYCAVLFDKDFSQYQSDRQATLNGSADGWPGLRVSDSIKPMYEDFRYRIYDLR